MVGRRRLLAIAASGPSSGGLCKLRSHIIWFSRLVLVNAPQLRSTISSRVLEVNVHTSCGISLQVCEWAKSGRGVPQGGNTGQLLVMIGQVTDLDIIWVSGYLRKLFLIYIASSNQFSLSCPFGFF